jgi:serine/threonine protein kinase
MMENGTKIRPDGTLLNTYELLSVLGKGSYGKVYKARRKIDGHVCVVKQVSLSGISSSEREEALNEVILDFHSLYYQIMRSLIWI